MQEEEKDTIPNMTSMAPPNRAQGKGTERVEKTEMSRERHNHSLDSQKSSRHALTLFWKGEVGLKQ